MHPRFEVEHSDVLRKTTAVCFEPAKSLVKKICALCMRFNIPAQTRWLGVITIRWSGCTPFTCNCLLLAEASAGATIGTLTGCPPRGHLALVAWQTPHLSQSPWVARGCRCLGMSQHSSPGPLFVSTLVRQLVPPRHMRQMSASR